MNFDLVRVQPGIGWHRTQPGGPAAEQELDKLAAIFERQQHPVARHETLCAQPTGQARGALGELAERQRCAFVADRQPVGQPARNVE
jgi:hypothetical protein